MAKKQGNVTWLGEKKSKYLAWTYAAVLVAMAGQILAFAVQILAPGFLVASKSPRNGSLEEAFMQLFIGGGLVLSLWGAYYLFCGIVFFARKLKKTKTIVLNVIILILAALQTAGGVLLLMYPTDRASLIGGIVLLVFGVAILVMAGLSIADVTVKPKLSAKARTKSDTKNGARRKS